MMKYSIRIPLLTFALFLMAAPSVAVGQTPQRCVAPYQAITELDAPYFGTPSVWDAELARAGKKVSLYASLPRAGGTLFSVGSIFPEGSDRPESLVLAELNYRGRALIEKTYKAKPDERPIDMITAGRDYIVASTYTDGKNRAARLSWYNYDGTYNNDIVIKDPLYHYELKALVKVPNEADFIALVQAQSVRDDSDVHSIFYRYNASGTLKRKRAFTPGAANTLYNVTPLAGNDHFLAMGAIGKDGGGMAGWVLELDRDGAIVWQHVYPRGENAELIGAVEAGGATRGFVVLGRSMPLDGGGMATWLMNIDGKGDPVWQHYYRDENYAIEPVAISSRGGGRLIVLTNAHAMPVEGEVRQPQNYIRLFTMSPRGALIGDEQYLHGIDAIAYNYVDGYTGDDPGTRIVTAASVVVPSPQTEADNMIGSGLFDLQEKDEDMVADTGDVTPQQRGWVFVGTRLNAYEDPCADEG